MEVPDSGYIFSTSLGDFKLYSNNLLQSSAFLKKKKAFFLFFQQLYPWLLHLYCVLNGLTVNELLLLAVGALLDA